ncbi:MAG: cryptochrome/photolyase family protein [Silicimonas sp.]|nr:cryptochrome/photolyase family protein [Silicimonas sp.]
MKTLVLILGDQLWLGSPALKRARETGAKILMVEATDEATYIPQHKMRLVLFFSAMRHFRQALEDEGFDVTYSELTDSDTCASIADELGRQIEAESIERVVCVTPGDARVGAAIKDVCSQAEVELEALDDTHFISTVKDFRDHAEGRKSLIMEYFYRELRKRTGILMDGGDPIGGQWNFDSDNRDTFGKDGPPDIPPPIAFEPDAITREVIEMVEERFADAPGKLENFAYPVTAGDAEKALDDFIENRLPHFGKYQDAMVTGEAFLYHSRLSTSLNLHLLDPRDAINAAVKAYEDGDAPLNSVEGFVRQILGWREFIRGIYWTKMPDYAEMNGLGADQDMPAFFWTGETDMVCVKDAVTQLNDHAYAHHIQRLMVLGLFAMLLGARPYDVHRWHMSMYADAIDWVSLPNVLGMSQHGDGGIVGTKPYSASGNYINKMSNYCKDCRFKPGKATGDDACPFTTLYWDFLDRNRDAFKSNHRMGFQMKNLDRKSDEDIDAIRVRAEGLKETFTEKTYLM